MSAREERSALRSWRFWRWWRRSKNRQPRTKEELAALIELSRPGATAQEQLDRLIFGVVFQCPRSPSEIIEAARDLQLSGQVLAALFQGEICHGVTVSGFKKVLEAWGADSVQIELGLDLFAEALHPAEVPGPRDGRDHIGAVLGGALGGVPNPHEATSSADLKRKMREFRASKGNPPFRTMANRIKKEYASSTLSTAAKEEGDKLPSLDVYLAYLRGCDATNEELADWKQAWKALAVAAEQAKSRSEG